MSESALRESLGGIDEGINRAEMATPLPLWLSTSLSESPYSSVHRLGAGLLVGGVGSSSGRGIRGGVCR